MPKWIRDLTKKFLKPGHKMVDLIGDDKIKAATTVQHLVLPCHWTSAPALVVELVKCGRPPAALPAATRPPAACSACASGVAAPPDRCCCRRGARHRRRGRRGFEAAGGAGTAACAAATRQGGVGATHCRYADPHPAVALLPAGATAAPAA
jgi:hypothetical protein